MEENELVQIGENELWAKIDGVVYKITGKQSQDGQWEYTDFLRTAYKEIPFYRITHRRDK